MAGSPLRLAAAPLGSTAVVSIVAALVIFGLGGWQILRTREAMLVDAERNTSTLARALAQHAGRTIESVDLNVRDVVRQVESGEDPQRLRAYLLNRDPLDQVFNLLVIDADGRWIADTVPPHGPASSADRGYFAWHRDHVDRGPHIDDLVVGKTSGKVTIPLSRRVDKDDGSFGGLVAGTLNPDFFRSLYQTVQMGPHGTIALWRDDGRMLVHFPELQKTDDASTALARARERSRAPSGVSRIRSSRDGSERIFAYDHVDTYPLTVSVAVSTDDALAGWRQDAAIEAGFVGASGLVLIAFGTAIERRRRQAALLAEASQEADRRYRLLAENASDLITLIPSYDGTHAYVSPASLAVVGYEPEELAAMPASTLIHPDDEARVAALFASLTIERPQAGSVHRVRHKAGYWVWLDVDFRVTNPGRPDQHVIARARDVTARHEAEQALVTSEARWNFALNSSEQGVWDVNIETGMSFYSPAWKALLGYADDELVTTGSTWLDLMHPADREAAERANLDYLGGRTATFDHEFRMRHKDGRWVWIHDRGKVIWRDAGGRPLRMIGTHTDVTAKKSFEHDMRVAKERAEAGMAAKAEFVANMSHELRAPLTGILGVHDLLASDPTLGENQRRLIQVAGDAGRSLLSIVNEILDLSKIDAGQMEVEAIAFDLDALVTSCGDLARESLKAKPVRFDTFSRPVVLGTVMGDPARIRQVLLNLLTNAVKFTPSGTIAVRAVFDETAGRLRIDVTDSGIGIPTDRVGTLFERFTQGDASMTRKYGGTGLGLAICKRLLDLMEGQIGVEPAPGGGSNFWFELPLLRPLGDLTASVGRPVEGGTAVSRLLLAEDSAMNAEIICAMLEAQGHAVTIVSDGLSAAEAACQDRGFDLIMMDMQMPVMDGIGATQTIRSHEARTGAPRTPIIGLTANAMAEDADRCLAAGMDAHVAKPVDWSILLATLNRLLGSADRSPSGAHDRVGSRDFREYRRAS